MKITAIIPARYGSTRFVGKPLADILGKPMIQYVYEGVSESRLIEDVIIATDDERIYEVVKNFGAKGILTSPKHTTGTDRIAEVARKLKSEIIVNIQGDEPLIKGSIIDKAIKPLIQDLEIPMGTIMTRIEDFEDWLNPNVVKVVVDNNGFALYFSRSPIPFPRDMIKGDWFKLDKFIKWPFAKNIFKHIGVYVYRREFLIKYSKMKPTPIEKLEKLEQLRALENGYRIKVTKVNYKSISVDTPDDLKKVIDILSNQYKNK
jgi:3-deoxy-manno-octulosonate cytidylyltransferase (CMP-KDO synthetase)